MVYELADSGTIHPDKVRPELRDKILAYQNECDDVLWRYWTEGRIGIYKHGETYGQSGQVAERRISIHADEFNELIGDEFIPLLNKAGGARATR